MIDDIIKAQVRDTNPNNKNKGSDLPPPQKRKKGKIMNKPVNVSYMDAPESVNNIGKEFIKQFMEKAPDEDRAWVILTLERENKIHGARKGFLTFRSEFASKFFPAIVAKNKSKEEKKSFLDELKKKYT